MVIFNRFHPNTVDSHEMAYIQKILQKYLYGFFICKTGGTLLYSWQVSPDLKLNLISQFISALSMFGEENMGKIKRILIEGLDIEISVTSQNDLICAALFHADMVKDHLDREGERILELFSQQFSTALKENRSNSAIYAGFDPIFWQIVENYLERVGILKINPDFTNVSVEISESVVK